jgi:steroid delta-isomerase-like uncharacterized protein
MLDSHTGESISEANKQLLRRWFEEVWNQRRGESIDAMLSPHARVYGLGGDSDPIGPAEFKTFHRGFCDAFPDIHIVVHDTIAEGDKVAVRWTVEVTHLGGGLGFPATGKRATMEGTTIATVKDGLIDGGWNFMDMTAFIAGLKTQ